MSHTELLDRILDTYANYPITELNMTELDNPRFGPTVPTEEETQREVDAFKERVRDALTPKPTQSSDLSLSVEDAGEAAINGILAQRNRLQRQVSKLKNEAVYNEVLINAGKQLAQYLQSIEVLPEECRAAIVTLLPPEGMDGSLDELLDPSITEEDIDKELRSMGVDPVALAERGSKFVQEAKAKDVEYLLRVEKSLLADVQQARKERDELQTTLTEERAKHKAQLKNLLDSIDGLLSKLP